MIAYRAEIWCDGDKCIQGSEKGISHDDHLSLPGLARNLIAIRLRDEGWTTDGTKHWCPTCSAKLAMRRQV